MTINRHLRSRNKHFIQFKKMTKSVQFNPNISLKFLQQFLFLPNKKGIETSMPLTTIFTTRYNYSTSITTSFKKKYPPSFSILGLISVVVKMY